MSERDTLGQRESGSSKGTGAYVRFLAMIATAMVVMYITTYLNTYELGHVEFSETRVFMTLIMGSTMALVMLGFMLGMYENRKANVSIVLGALVVLMAATWLVRSQTTVQEESYMRAMIPHHSIAILTSENSQIGDQRVCELAVEIIEAQRREIDEMNWLLADIAENGPAISAEDGAQRQVPEFGGTALRTCG
jgi:Kef-type K+ transport system membrane component KefB